MAGNIGFEHAFKTQYAVRTTEKSPYKILVCGDYSGRSAGNPAAAMIPLAQRPMKLLDIDNFDSFWNVFEPHLVLNIEGTELEFMPRDLEDFHPDRLYRSMRVFADLRDRRKRLLDPATADETLAEILSSGPLDDSGSEESPQPEAPSSGGDDMFERLLGRASVADTPALKPAHQDGLNALIQRLVEPHVIHDPNPQLQVVVDSVDEAISSIMRGLLHDPGFQALEAAWLSLYEMVTRIETGEDLQILVCDVSRDELLDGLPDANTAFEDSHVYHLLVNRFRKSANDSPVSLIVGCYEFGTQPDDVSLLAALGACAQKNGASFLAGAKPETAGIGSLADHPDPKEWADVDASNPLWHSLRSNEVTSAIGLALPRVLLRLPYGRDTEEIDTFEFEEMPQPSHEDYLWGNPAVFIACLIAQGVGSSGSSGLPGSQLEIGELPAHIFNQDGERRMKPCAEVLISERAAETLLNRGIMPVISYRDRNAASLLRMQSISNPPTALSGRTG
jgi:type VI secretion system ImpC/EvpB family protein